MNKIKVFFSSRVNTSSSLDKKFTLSDLRKYLRDELQSALFLDEKLLEIIINEDSFDSAFDQNAFDNCLAKMKECNLIVILYNGEAGWNVGANGICHDEFLVAMQEFSGMTYAINLTALFTPKSRDEANIRFRQDVDTSFRHMESISASSVDDLKKKVLTQIKRYLLKSIENSFATRKQIDSASSTFGLTLNWSKLTYDDRQKAIKENLKNGLTAAKFFEDVICDHHCIPDHMSVADARNRIGRPFLQEHKLLQKEKRGKGAIHVIAVYGNATETQVKNLVGFPDVAVIKASFGYYLWETTSHIQIFFIPKSVNPSAVRMGIDQLTQWLRVSQESNKISNRAKARFSILRAIEKAQTATNQ